MKPLTLLLAIICLSFSASETKEVTIIGQAVDYKTGEPVRDARLMIMYNPGSIDSMVEYDLCITDSNGFFEYSAQLNLENPVFTLVNNKHAHIQYEAQNFEDTIHIAKHYMITFNSEYESSSDDPEAICLPLFGNLTGDSIPKVVDYMKNHHKELIANPVDTVQMSHSATNSASQCFFQYKFLSFKSTL